MTVTGLHCSPANELWAERNGAKSRVDGKFWTDSDLRFPESLNACLESLNVYLESLNICLESLNTYLESLNALSESLNVFPESLNVFPESLTNLPDLDSAKAESYPAHLALGNFAGSVGTRDDGWAEDAVGDGAVGGVACGGLLIHATATTNRANDCNYDWN